MKSIRDIKRKARRHLHKALRVPVLYYAPVEDPEPVLLHVRLHTKWDATTMDGTQPNGTLVSRQSIMPKILFMLDELDTQDVRLRKKGIVSVEAGEAYRLDNDEPVDDISVSWIVSALRKEETVGLSVPSDLDE
jgi:hypothetical protein